MALHVQELLSNCKTCQRWNQAKRVYTQLKAIHANLPWNHVQMESITTFPCTEDGYKVILTIVDLFTSPCIKIPLKLKEVGEIFDVKRILKTSTYKIN